MAFEITDYSWSSDIPKRCPPNDAHPAQGVFYRAVKCVPPTEMDFLRWIDEPHNLGKKKNCDAFSISLFSSVEALKKSLFDRFPNRWSKESGCGVVEVVLGTDVGVMQQGRADPSHYNLWLQNGITLISYAAKVVEI